MFPPKTVSVVCRCSIYAMDGVICRVHGNGGSSFGGRVRGNGGGRGRGRVGGGGNKKVINGVGIRDPNRFFTYKEWANIQGWENCKLQQRYDSK